MLRSPKRMTFLPLARNASILTSSACIPEEETICNLHCDSLLQGKRSCKSQEYRIGTVSCLSPQALGRSSISGPPWWQSHAWTLAASALSFSELHPTPHHFSDLEGSHSIGDLETRHSDLVELQLECKSLLCAFFTGNGWAIDVEKNEISMICDYAAALIVNQIQLLPWIAAVAKVWESHQSQQAVMFFTTLLCRHNIWKLESIIA